MLIIYNLTLTIFLIYFSFYSIRDNDEKFILRLIFIFHLIFFLINFFYKDYFASDSNGYIKWSEDGSYPFMLGNGTSSVVFFVEFLKSLQINNINIHLIFSLFGFFGIYIFYKVINSKNSHIFNKIIFFIPSWHFYTSTLGKESLIVFLLSISLFFFDNRKILLFAITILIIYLIRPNVSILFSTLLIPLIINLCFKKFSIKQNVVLKIFPILIIIFSLILIYLKNQEIQNLIAYINTFIETRQQYHYLGRTGYKVDELNFFQVIFYYLFMPMGINFNKNIFYFYSSIENILLSFYFLLSLITFKYKKIKIISLNSSLFIFLMVFLFLVSIVNTNLGLAMRQKWMILPFVFYIFSIYCDYPNITKK